MIIDHIQHISNYLNLSPEITEGLQFLRNTNLKSLSIGRHELPGPHGSYALIQSYQTKPRHESWEAHRQYADIQYIIQGRELIGHATLPSLKMGDYQAKDDYALGTGEGHFLKMTEGCFMILLPQDGHMPGIMEDSPQNILKAVVKVKLKSR